MTAPRAWMPLDAWQRLVDGVDCPLCATAASTADDALGFYVGRLPLSAVRLSRNQAARGYTVVVCRRHVVEPFELPPEERRQFFEDVLAVGQALQRLYQPLKLNYQILGNAVPHLHCHVLPRYHGDPAPHAPLPLDALPIEMTLQEYEVAVRRLREELGDQLEA